MRTNMSIRRAAALTAVAGLAACVSTARGTIINWNNAAGGAASTAANWNPAQVPTAADTLVYNLNSTYTVTFSGGVALSTQHTYKRGTVTLSMSSPHTLSGNFRVGDVSGDAATSVITTGDVTAGSVTVGNAAGSTGTLRVNDSDARLFTSGAGDVVVGAAGNGTLTVNGGGLVQSADDVILGSSGGDGTASVSGFGITPIRFSTLSSSGVDGDIIVGNSSGAVSTLTVTDSGIVNAADDLVVAPISGSNGLVNAGGNGNIATINVGGDLLVGNNSSSTSAGSGQVSALNGGTIDVTGVIRLGDTTVGSGTLTCRDGGAINAHSIICDSDGGFLNLLGGETRVDGGVLTAPNNILSIEGASTETPFLRLLNGASCSLSAPVSPFRALTIGIINDANLVVDTGSSLTVSSGDVVVGDLPAAQGSLVFSGGSTGTFPAGRRITVGASAFGDMIVTGNSSVTGGSMELGAGSAGNGSLLVYGSDLTLAGTLSVGGTPTAPGGVGEVRVEAAGMVTVNATGSAVRVYAGGIVLIFPGATLKATGGSMEFDSNALLTLDNGTLQARELHIGVLNPSLRGTLGGQVWFNASSTVVNPTGPLTINGSGSSFALLNVGTINVGNTTLTINGGTELSAIGNCTLGATGVLQGTAPLKLHPGKTLSGDGTINNSVMNEGTITATGDGLTFGGVVSGVGQGMGGVRFTFANGGGFTGAGSIGAKVVAQQGSKLTISGNSAMGDGSTFGATIDGELEIVSGTLTVNDSNGIGLGTLTTIHQSGTLLCTSAINMGSVPAPDVIQGDGEVASIVNCAGIIRPGFAGQDETGELEFNILNLFSGSVKGEVDIDLAGSAAADCDRVRCFGPVFLDGLLKVRLINGFVPDNGFRTSVINSSDSMLGSFASTDLPARFHTEFDGARVWVVFCAADVNNDGFVNGDDFDNLASAFENGEALGDFNGDGFINGDDFDEFASAFEEGC